MVPRHLDELTSCPGSRRAGRSGDRYVAVPSAAHAVRGSWYLARAAQFRHRRPRTDALTLHRRARLAVPRHTKPVRCAPCSTRSLQPLVGPARLAAFLFVFSRLYSPVGGPGRCAGAGTSRSQCLRCGASRRRVSLAERRRLLRASRGVFFLRDPHPVPVLLSRIDRSGPRASRWPLIVIPAFRPRVHPLLRTRCAVPGSWRLARRGSQDRLTTISSLPLSLLRDLPSTTYHGAFIPARAVVPARASGAGAVLAVLAASSARCSPPSSCAARGFKAARVLMYCPNIRCLASATSAIGLFNAPRFSSSARPRLLMTTFILCRWGFPVSGHPTSDSQSPGASMTRSTSSSRRSFHQDITSPLPSMAARTSQSRDRHGLCSTPPTTPGRDALEQSRPLSLAHPRACLPSLFVFAPQCFRPRRHAPRYMAKCRMFMVGYCSCSLTLRPSPLLDRGRVRAR